MLNVLGRHTSQTRKPVLQTETRLVLTQVSANLAFDTVITYCLFLFCSLFLTALYGNKAT